MSIENPMPKLLHFLRLAMSIENPMPKLLHSRGVLCVLKPHTALYGAGTSS